VQNENGERVSKFRVIATVEVCVFQIKIKESIRINIVEIVSLSSYFPRFTNEDQNLDLMAKVKKGDMEKLVDSFQKDKSLGPDGWPIEFYLGFYKMLEDDLLIIV